MRTFSVTLFALAAVFSSAYGAPVVLRDALEIEEPILAPAPANALNGTEYVLSYILQVLYNVADDVLKSTKPELQRD